MEVHKHVNDGSPLNIWQRATKVGIDGKWLTCDLAHGGAYNLMEAYQRSPHIAFMNIKSEDQLVVFIRTWGPLSVPDNSPKGTSQMLVSDYWNCRDHLNTTAGLLRAFHQRGEERKALAEFLAAQIQQNPSSVPPVEQLKALMLLQDDPVARNLAETCGPDGVLTGEILLTWNQRTDSSHRHRLIAILIESAFQATARIVAHWQTRAPRLEAVWDLTNLAEALTWMVYQDVLAGHVPQPCPECLAVFRPPFRHHRKFCSYACAHRVAARKWRRKDLRRTRQV